jgi:hypothetical protein
VDSIRKAFRNLRVPRSNDCRDTLTLNDFAVHETEHSWGLNHHACKNRFARVGDEIDSLEAGSLCNRAQESSRLRHIAPCVHACFLTSIEVLPVLSVLCSVGQICWRARKVEDISRLESMHATTAAASGAPTHASHTVAHVTPLHTTAAIHPTCCACNSAIAPHIAAASPPTTTTITIHLPPRHHLLAAHHLASMRCPSTNTVPELATAADSCSALRPRHHVVARATLVLLHMHLHLHLALLLLLLLLLLLTKTTNIARVLQSSSGVSEAHSAAITHAGAHAASHITHAAASHVATTNRAASHVMTTYSGISQATTSHSTTRHTASAHHRTSTHATRTSAHATRASAHATRASAHATRASAHATAASATDIAHCTPAMDSADPHTTHTHRS